MPEIFAINSTHDTPLAPAPTKPSASEVFSKMHTHDGVSFQKQDPDEKIILLLRQHFITNTGWILTTVALLLMPFLIGIVVGLLTLPLPSIPTHLIPVVLATYYVFVALYAIVKFINWLYNVFIITQKRIIDIDFSDVIYHDVAITKVEEVEDVHYSQGGFLSSIFNYGNLHIQTQADKANFEAFGIPDPANAAHIIVELTGKGGRDD